MGFGDFAIFSSNTHERSIKHTPKKTNHRTVEEAPSLNEETPAMIKFAFPGAELRRAPDLHGNANKVEWL